MSIVKTRQFLEKSGCGWITSIIIGIVTFVGILAFGGGGFGRHRGEEEDREILKVGDLTVTSSLMDVIIRKMSENGASLDSLPPSQQAEVVSNLLRSFTQAGYALEAAKKQGVTIGDAEVKAGLEQVKQQMAESYAPNFRQSPADFAKSSDGKRLIERGMDLYVKIGEIPSGKDFLRGQFATTPLIEAAKKRFNPSDDEVKHGYDELTLASLTVSPTTGKDDLQQKVDEALAEIRKDGFAKVQAKYAKASPGAGGISAGATPLKLARSQVAMMPDWGPKLAALKVGETSEPIKLGRSTVIYNLTAVKDNAPKDYDKRRAELRQSYIEQKAREEVSKQIDAQEKETKIEWMDKGYEILYEWSRAPKTYEAQMDVADRAEKLVGADNVTNKFAQLARYAAFDQAWQMATPKQKKDHEKDRASVLEEVLRNSEDADLRLELADIYIDQKQAAQAIGVLETAAQTAKTEEAFTKIDLRVKRILAEKLADPKKLQAISDAKAIWLKDKAEEQKNAAEFDKIEAQKKKEREAEAKAFDEAKKKAEAEKKAAVGKAPSTNSPAGK